MVISTVDAKKAAYKIFISVKDDGGDTGHGIYLFK